MKTFMMNEKEINEGQKLGERKLIAENVRVKRLKKMEMVL